MAKLTLKQAAQMCGGYVEEQYENVEFFGANNDTRIIKPGQLFIVLQGARDGHDFMLFHKLINYIISLIFGKAFVLCIFQLGYSAFLQKLNQLFTFIQK